MSVNSFLSCALKNVMEVEGWNQVDVAAHSGISQSMVTKMLQGKPARHSTYLKLFHSVKPEQSTELRQALMADIAYKHLRGHKEQTDIEYIMSNQIIGEGCRDFKFVDLKRPAGRVQVKLADKSEHRKGTKDRAEWLLEALGAVWTRRTGYHIAKSKAEKFALLYIMGWSSSTMKILVHDARPQMFDKGGAASVTLSEAVAQARKELEALKAARRDQNSNDNIG